MSISSGRCGEKRLLVYLPGIIDKLIEAVRAGELEDQFALASAERGLMLKRAG